jgi:membrane fusion protein, multidrug efflux system
VRRRALPIADPFFGRRSRRRAVAVIARSGVARSGRAAALAAALAAVAALAAGCSGDKQGTQTAAAAPATGQPGAGSRGAPGAPGGPGGGRGAPSVALSASDVSVVRRGAIEASTPIAGDLRPVETVEVRARLEGDLVGVYVNEGERVSAGQLLARFEASEQVSDRRSAEAERAAAEAALNTAQWNAEQSAELFRAGAIPERDHRVAEQAVTAARAQLAAAEARVRSTGSFVTDTRVLSPVNGVVERRVVQNGERVARGAPMFTVVRNDVLELTASVPARAAGDVRAGQTVRFTADGRAFDGTVARVSPTIDPVTRSLTVYVRIPNRGGTLKGNAFATGRVVGRTIEGVLIVPTTALRQSGDDSASFVYRLAGGVVDRTPVRLGVVDEATGVAQVLEGVSEGDRVIVGNVGAIGSGMRATVVGEGTTAEARGQPR